MEKNPFNLDMYAFLEYAAINWGAHYRKACINPSADLLSSTLGICNLASRTWSAWFMLYWKTTRYGLKSNITSFMVSSYVGIEAVVKALLEKGVETESHDKIYHRAPLSWAVAGHHESIITQLLDNGANIESIDAEFATPLSCAARDGLDTIVNLLLERGASFDSKDGTYHRTPLSWVVVGHHESTVRQLLDRDVDPDSVECHGL